jgi:hypothetical protein
MAITDLTLFRDKTRLLLCLDVIEDVCKDLRQGNYALAEIELQNVLLNFRPSTNIIDLGESNIIELPGFTKE